MSITAHVLCRSHPGYGCWLSGIDVSTEKLYQDFTEPFVAVVVCILPICGCYQQIDPVRTAAAGKVEIGAFRTYPKGYKPASTGSDDYRAIPLSKIDDFGVHAELYYPLEVSFFQSSTDSTLCRMLWSRYWATNLSANHADAVC